MTIFTASELEETLARTEYRPIERIDKRTLTGEQRAEAWEIERLTSLGKDIITLFDDMISDLERLPTQKEYVERGMGHLREFFAKRKPEIDLTSIKLAICEHRLARTYMSKLVELHLHCIIKEHTNLKVIENPLLDSVAGYDAVLEDDGKRYYIHVISNTYMAKKMLIEKENRGGYRVNNTYVPYSRDFDGDLIFKYDTHHSTDTTMQINGFPLFRDEFVTFRLSLAKTQKVVGESLSEPNNKLKHFNEWAKMYIHRK